MFGSGPAGGVKPRVHPTHDARRLVGTLLTARGWWGTCRRASPHRTGGPLARFAPPRESATQGPRLDRGRPTATNRRGRNGRGLASAPRSFVGVQLEAAKDNDG